MKIQRLREIAMERRRDIIRMDYAAASGHPGGSLSCIDILVALYFEVMDITVENFLSFERDRFILSKGHSAEALYTVLAAKGFFSRDELSTYEQEGSRLYGHPTKKAPGVEMNTGSLGHGLSAAVGMAIAQKMDGIKRRVFVLLGDGEMAEGSNWEAIMSAGHYKLDNLVAIVDRNRMQISGSTESVLSQHNLCGKFESFGWSALEVNGHDMAQLVEALSSAASIASKPTFLCANTVKGKGVSFMENQAQWHHGVMTIDQYKQAMKELDRAVSDDE